MSAQTYISTDSDHLQDDHNGIALTQQDLDNGLSPEQINWLVTNLNVKPLIRALHEIAQRTSAPEDEAAA